MSYYGRISRRLCDDETHVPFSKLVRDSSELGIPKTEPLGVAAEGIDTDWILVERPLDPNASRCRVSVHDIYDNWVISRFMHDIRFVPSSTREFRGVLPGLESRKSRRRLEIGAWSSFFFFTKEIRARSWFTHARNRLLHCPERCLRSSFEVLKMHQTSRLNHDIFLQGNELYGKCLRGIIVTLVAATHHGDCHQRPIYRISWACLNSCDHFQGPLTSPEPSQTPPHVCVRRLLLLVLVPCFCFVWRWWSWYLLSLPCFRCLSSLLSPLPSCSRLQLRFLHLPDSLCRCPAEAKEVMTVSFAEERGVMVLVLEFREFLEFFLAPSMMKVN